MTATGESQSGSAANGSKISSFYAHGLCPEASGALSLVPATRAPKGLYDSAQGFNPGFQPWEPSSKGICPEVARDGDAFDGWHYACDLEALQGSSRGRNGSQG